MDTRYLTHDDEEAFKALLIGHTVTKVDDRKMVLDNGIELSFPDTDGGCACSAGCYELTELNACDNIITNVVLHSDPDGDDYPEGEGLYQIFVYANARRINLATWSGSDGNGYYGTGFSVTVRGAA